MMILVDAMGGDNAPDAVIKGAVRASKEIKSEICLVGNEEIINQKVKEFYGKDKIRVTKNHFGSTENIEQNFGGIVPFEDSETMVDGTEFTKGDILIANIRPYLKKIWQSDMDGACNADVLVLKPQEIDNVFLYFLVAQNKFIDYVMGGVKGSKMPRGDKAHILSNIILPYLLYWSSSE